MKGKCGHKKSIIYSDNPKMDTSGMSSVMTIEMMESGGPVEVKDMGAVVKYGTGGKVYTNKNDKDTEEDMKDLQT
jgi:hypothetical protein